MRILGVLVTATITATMPPQRRLKVTSRNATTSATTATSRTKSPRSKRRPQPRPPPTTTGTNKRMCSKPRSVSPSVTVISSILRGEDVGVRPSRTRRSLQEAKPPTGSSSSSLVSTRTLLVLDQSGVFDVPNSFHAKTRSIR